jgi:denticleless
MLTFFVKACLSPDGKYLASGSNDESAYIWHTQNPGSPLIKLSGHRDEVTCVAWCNTGETKVIIIFNNKDKILKILSLSIIFYFII